MGRMEHASPTREVYETGIVVLAKEIRHVGVPVGIPDSVALWNLHGQIPPHGSGGDEDVPASIVPQFCLRQHVGQGAADDGELPPSARRAQSPLRTHLAFQGQNLRTYKNVRVHNGCQTVPHAGFLRQPPDSWVGFIVHERRLVGCQFRLVLPEIRDLLENVFPSRLRQHLISAVLSV